MEGPERAIAEALWEKVAEDFSAERSHQAFLTHCSESGLLDYAAARYKSHREALPPSDASDASDDGEEGDHPDRAVADKQLAAIALLAMARLDAMKSAAREPARRIPRWLLIVAVSLTLAAVALLLHALAQ